LPVRVPAQTITKFPKRIIQAENIAVLEFYVTPQPQPLLAPLIEDLVALKAAVPIVQLLTRTFSLRTQ
jgi:hypothetical protein